MNPVFWMLSACASFAVVNGCVKVLNRIPTWEIVFFRSVINLIFFLPYVVGHPPKSVMANWKREIRFLILRGVAGCTSMALYFYAIEHLKLADAVMLNYTSPIWVLILSSIFLKDRLTVLSLLFIALTFAGVGFILKPDAEFMHSLGQFGPGVAGFLSAFTAGFAYIFMKVSTRYAPSNFIVATFAAVCTLISVVPTILVFKMPTFPEWGFILALGCLATYAQFAMTKAYAMLPASVVSPLSASTVVFAIFIGWVFWQEIPDAWSIGGSALVIAGLVGAYRFRYKPRPV